MSREWLGERVSGVVGLARNERAAREANETMSREWLGERVSGVVGLARNERAAREANEEPNATVSTARDCTSAR